VLPTVHAYSQEALSKKARASSSRKATDDKKEKKGKKDKKDKKEKRSSPKSADLLVDFGFGPSEVSAQVLFVV
jgi:hypothetical protein